MKKLLEIFKNNWKQISLSYLLYFISVVLLAFYPKILGDTIDHLVDGDYYEDEIYTQRFYKKWVYEGKELTMVFCDPHTDGMKWFRVFDNSKKQ